MPIENPRYDVALSFLSRDEAIAKSIYQRLAEGLEVFFFPRSQEELAAKDGLESMREPFLDDSRLMVVLYRDGWGKTPWTRVEETAIKDACFQYGWERLCFIVLEAESTPPIWLPKHYVRFNYADYGLEQAVGLIKARVQERGGQNHPLTPLKRAQLLEAEEAFQTDKTRMNSQEGLSAIFKSVGELFQEVEKHCNKVSQTREDIEWRISLKQREISQTFVLTDGHVGLNIQWIRPYVNSLDGSALFVREYNGRLILPTGHIYVLEPQLLREMRYQPDLSIDRRYGWKLKDGTEFVSSATLAQRCVIQFLDLVARYVRGEIKPQRLI